jgi:uncharacterized protein (DUF1800 family)
MRDSSIALNRFGLGARLDDDPVTDARHWLLDQLGKFDQHPAALRGLPGSDQLVMELGEIRDARRERKQERPAPETSAMGRDQNPQITLAPTRPPVAKIPGLYKPLRDQYVAAVGARTASALASDTPFVERMVHFWANHFAVSIDKIAVVGLAGAFEFEAIRPHVLGKFGDLLAAVEHHPAMLLYLDQAQSIGPGSVVAQRAAARGRARGLNENLAREILELHTLGVRSVYSQADVTEFARSLTGWTVGGLGRQPFLTGSPGRFLFAEPLHEPGTRQILGQRYGEGGEGQAQAVLSDLAIHPATARHIATKLARHFAADEPPPALVARLEAAYLHSGGDLPVVYRALINAPEPWSGAAKFRTPWEWAIAALRATGTSALPGATVAGAFDQLGQAVWKPGSPAGFDDVAPSWAGPDALVRRVEVAQRIASHGTDIDARQLAARLFPNALSEATGTAIARAESPAQGLALLLSSPEMMRR